MEWPHQKCLHKHAYVGISTPKIPKMSQSDTPTIFLLIFMGYQDTTKDYFNLRIKVSLLANEVMVNEES